jgi:hypothetical protein
MNTNLNLYQVNTTAWDEEDFLILTSLTEEQVTNVLTPIINKLRDEEDDDYDNDFLVGELVKAYPNATIIHYNPSQIDLISI